MPSESTDPLKPVRVITKHFWKCMGSSPTHKELWPSWMDSIQALLEGNGLTPEELYEFMTWATQENTNDRPQFNSVEYLAASNDPMKTLVKYSEGLLKVWRNRKRAASYTKVSKPSKPLPRDMAEWMMLGPGVNQPRNGWGTARQKMDKIKIGWYGKGGENQPDPEGIDIEQLFVRYQRIEY